VTRHDSPPPPGTRDEERGARSEEHGTSTSTSTPGPLLPSRERAILHLNVADFAVAVERVVDPGLKDRPVLVAPQGAARAAIYDMSEEAFRAGVRKGMALRRARKLCPDARLLPPHPDRYERAMRELLHRVLPLSPRIEAVDEKGHLFVDLSGTGRLHGPPPDVAWRLRKQLRAELRLDPIWSLAANKLLAKVATRIVKPVGECIVEPGEEEAFLRPLPLRLLPGLEPEELQRLAELHTHRVGELASWSLAQLAVLFGSHARPLHELVRGVAPSPVLRAGEQRPSVVAEEELGDDSNDQARIEGLLYRLVEKLGAELRARRLAAPGLTLNLDYSDGVRLSRQATAPVPTANDRRLFALARQALALAWCRRVRLRHLRLRGDRLRFPPAQLELFTDPDAGPAPEERLVDALDRIRGRFGRGAIQVGRTLAAAG